MKPMDVRRRTMKTNRDDGRMIHIRLSAETHKKLRIRAAEQDVSIQALVESLIEGSLKIQEKKGRS